MIIEPSVEIWLCPGIQYSTLCQWCMPSNCGLPRKNPLVSSFWLDFNYEALTLHLSRHRLINYLFLRSERMTLYKLSRWVGTAQTHRDFKIASENIRPENFLMTYMTKERLPHLEPMKSRKSSYLIGSKYWQENNSKLSRELCLKSVLAADIAYLVCNLLLLLFVCLDRVSICPSFICTDQVFHFL